MVFEVIMTSDSAFVSELIGIVSIIPLIIGFFRVIYRSLKSLFVAPKKDQSEYLPDIQQSLIPEDFSSVQSEETTEVSQKPEAKQSLIDPCGIMDQYEYFNFIDDPDVNHFASFFRVRKCNAKMIPGIVTLLLVLTYIALDTCSFIKSQAYKVPKRIVSHIIRTIFYFFSLPFLMIFNFVGLFMDSAKAKLKHSFIRTMWILVSLAYLVLIIVSILVIVVFRLKFSKFVPENFVYEKPDTSAIISEPASICGNKFYGLDLIQYAGISSLGQTNDLKLSREILKYMFDGNEKNFTLYSNSLTFFYEVEINNTFSVVSFNSLTDLNSVSVLLENFLNDFISDTLFGSIIPFYELTYNLFLSRFMNILSQGLTSELEIPRMTDFYIASNQLIYLLIAQKNKNAVYVGHSIGGLFAKGIGSYFKVPSIGIESLNLYRSTFDASMSVNLGEIEFNTNGFQMINLYSPSQIFAQADANSTMNIVLPKWKGTFEYINPYEATCLIAAGCAVDSKYDKFCDKIMGIDQYKYLFQLWNRTRSD